ncbi:SIP domain-containing protein [Glaciihabitans sp. UYNi722]|uniref:SIP domain-containing protein n=1 Tax=Glaciihabitans sp. UYNi722 TaxID=3156344 RepID=UPI0033957973
MATSDSLTASIAWNPGVKDRLLIAGDESSLPAIQTLLATLPSAARGQVFVEVETSDDVATLLAPGRVAICWLVRDRGQSLRRSLDAWLSEMLPTDITQQHTVYSWIAGSGAARALSSD